MLAFSHDPDAGTLYIYFAELEAGQVATSLEYPAQLLLDTQGRIIGFQLALDDELTLANLELALDGDFERLDMDSGRFSIRVAAVAPARSVALADTAILDLDADDTVLGVELLVPAELRSDTALERLAPFMIALDEPEPGAGEGPVVFVVDEPAAAESEVAEPEAPEPPPVAASAPTAAVAEEPAAAAAAPEAPEPEAPEPPPAATTAPMAAAAAAAPEPPAAVQAAPQAASQPPGSAAPVVAPATPAEAPSAPLTAAQGAPEATTTTPAPHAAVVEQPAVAQSAPEATTAPAPHAAVVEQPAVAQGTPEAATTAPGSGAPASQTASGPTRSGFVALVGKPNVGKSTLLNALLGQKVTIVSPRPQTTRVPTRGILSRPDAQIIFVDTPGIHQPSHALGRMMVDLAEHSLPNADVIGFMVDISQPPSELDRRIAEQVLRARGHRLLILNKVDLKPRGERNYLEAYRALAKWDEELAISARRRLGLSTLLDAIVARLPEGPPLYPDERVTDQSEQQLAAEFVREKVLFHTQHEVPHAVAVVVDEWEEREPATFIRMTINVERDGQKAIIIGTGGAMLKKIGSAARFEIERMLEHKVFLELWVKVRPNWRDDPAALGWLGYRAKDWR